MTRRLLNLLTALSLLLCVAVAALWVRGQWYFDEVAFTNGDGDGFAVSSGGRGGGVECSVRRVSQTTDSGRRLSTQSAAHSAWWVRMVGVRSTRLGFGADRLKIGVVRGQCVKVLDYSGVVVPHWALLIVLSALPVVCGFRWACQYMRQGRPAAGLCPACGYDLRATPDRCPECGTAASVSAMG